jgi:hypothetical protein
LGTTAAVRPAGRAIPIRGKEMADRWQQGILRELVWNAYWMKPDVVARFLVWLHGRKLFDCNAGWCDAYDLWNQHEPINANRLIVPFPAGKCYCAKGCVGF